MEEKSDYDSIRVWVPGCSTGEEVYSIAIIIKELMEESGKTFEVQIFGTDIDRDAIKTARSGTYQGQISTDVGPERLKKYFIQKDNFYVIKNEIREMAVFAPHDVLKDPPFTKIDILSCRNLLIYLKSESQQKALSNFNYSLNNNGILFLGPSENLGDFIDAFSVIDKKWKIFKCVKSTNFALRYVTEHPMPNQIPLTQDMDLNFEEKKGMVVSNITRLAENELLKIYAPPSVIINEFGEILYIHGRLGNYLEPAQGRAKFDILEMAREGLEFDLNSTIQAAVSKKREVLVEGVRFKSNGEYSFINLRVKPIIGPEFAEKLLIVSFEDLESHNDEKIDKLKPDLISNSNKHIKKLENEIKLTKERLDITIEEMKTSNEELKSANEELQSMNEESQSTNEELETSKEELQSINEELSTVNNELQMKIDDLSIINDDMENLFNSTEIATIFLDKNLNIRRFTPESIKIVKMIDSDVGRPISDIVSNLKYDKLTEDIRNVIKRVVFKEKEVQTVNGEWYSMRIMPYKTSQDVIDGAVLTFASITNRKKIQEKLQEALNYSESIVDTVREPLLVLDNEMKIISANKSFYKTFKMAHGELEGKKLFNLGEGEWDLPMLRDLLEKILPEKKELNDFEIDLPQIQSNKILINARQIHIGQKGSKMILIAIEII
jgi:two-component system CheB/CheR fusion protein